MSQHFLATRKFNAQLEELEKLIELRPLSRDALQQRVQHLSGSSAEQIQTILDGLRKGTYDNPSGWVQALRQLQASHQENSPPPLASKSTGSEYGSFSRFLFRKSRLAENLLRLGVGLLLGVVFLLTTSPAFKSCLIFLMSLFFFTGVFIFISFKWPAFVESTIKRLAGAIAILSSSLFYIIEGSSLPLLGLSWIMLIFGVIGLFSTLQRVVMDLMTIHMLLENFKRNEPMDIPMPIVYVVAQPGLGAYFSHRLAAKVAQALSRYQFSPNQLDPRLAREGTPVRELSPRLKRLTKGGPLVYFLISDSLERFSPKFREWVLQKCPALVVVRLPGSATLSEAARQEFEEQLRAGFLTTAGPTFDFRVIPPTKGDKVTWPPDKLSLAADVSQDASGFKDGAYMGVLIAPLVQRLSSTVIPIFWADFRLPPALRNSIESWGGAALAPIADIYLRLRLAQSDVERFMVSLEAIELLAKLSAIVLVATSWQAGEINKRQKVDGNRLTLGSWRESLEWEVENSRSPEAGIRSVVREFWRRPTSGIQNDVVRLVAQSSGILQSESRIPYARQLDWMTWFVDLRNATRGHGVIEEGRVAPFWELLYIILIEMVDGLKELTLLSELLFLDTEGNELALRGWLRKGSRSLAAALLGDSRVIKAVYLEISATERLPLFPLIFTRGYDIFFWDGWAGKGKFQALSYSTGTRCLVGVASERLIDLPTIWASGSSADLVIETSEVVTRTAV